MWSEQKIVADDGGPKSWFGSWVTVSDTMALVGARAASVDGRANQGAVYVLRKANGKWSQVQKLVASDGAAGDQFGAAIALHGSLAVITAPFARVNGRTWQGAAYLFALVGGTWTERQKLVSASGISLDTLGTAVAFNASTIFIGAGGANTGGQIVPRKVYTFEAPLTRNGPWIEGPTLPSPDPVDVNDSFGASIAVSADVALIGARASTIGANIGQGRVYVYERSHGAWTSVQKLVATDGGTRDNFGVSLAIDGTTAMIGAPGVVINGQVSTGAVYCWERTHGAWAQTSRLIAADGAAINLFGGSVSLSGNTMLVGAYGANAYRGAAYLFRRIAGSWKQVEKLTAGDAAPGNVFGYYTAVDARTALVGSYTAKVGSNVQQGAAYFYTDPATDT
ncbi:FG-GAP repeat protein [Dokdonella sp.]|uniref:FG-GAP repeat protein n=1 Tax=Dokdonella sp. TaxID=2291710 RepID=UPI003782DC74